MEKKLKQHLKVKVLNNVWIRLKKKNYNLKKKHCFFWFQYEQACYFQHTNDIFNQKCFLFCFIFSIFYQSFRELGASIENVPWNVLDYHDDLFLRYKHLWLEVIRGQSCTDIWNWSTSPFITTSAVRGTLITYILYIIHGKSKSMALIVIVNI